MSILIKDMKMPKNCAVCPFGKCESCHINLMLFGHDKSDCPLVPVPPHGRLIDADALNFNDVDLCGNHYLYMNEIRKVIEAASTIIPAEEGE